MVRVRWDVVVLLVFMVLLFWFRMELATSVENLSYESYLTVREVEHIQETGRPLTKDPLSVTGRTRVGSPIFSYILAGFAGISAKMYKILPNLVMVGLLIPLFIFTVSLTQSRTAGVIAVVLAGTGPAVFARHLITPSAIPLALMIFLIVLVMVQQPKRYLLWIVSLTVFLTFLSPLIFLVVFSLLLIILLLRFEGFGIDRRINELFFFTLILAIWYHVLVYKKALFLEGLRILWQNLPTTLAATQFGPVTFLRVLYAIGVVAVLFGIFGIYHALFERRQRASLTIIGAILAVLIFLLVRVIELRVGLLFLGTLLSIMAAYGIVVSTSFMERTKAPWLIWPIGAGVVLLFVFTAIIPALASAQVSLDNAPSASDVSSFIEMRRLPRGAVMLTTVREAAAVQYFSQRATLTDQDFLLVGNGEELVRDIDAVYTARFTTPVILKAEKLGFTHILFSHDASERYGRDKLQIDEALCLEQMLFGDVIVYRVQCRGAQ